jgi:hypothetical protein
LKYPPCHLAKKWREKIKNHGGWSEITEEKPLQNFHKMYHDEYLIDSIDAHKTTLLIKRRSSFIKTIDNYNYWKAHN